MNIKIADSVGLTCDQIKVIFIAILGANCDRPVSVNISCDEVTSECYITIEFPGCNLPDELKSTTFYVDHTNPQSITKKVLENYTVRLRQIVSHYDSLHKRFKNELEHADVRLANI